MSAPGNTKQSAFFIALLVWSLGMLLLFWPLLTSPYSQTLWADDFDSNLLKWIAEWGYYSLGQKHSLSLFWNAYSFYPEKLTLAYSDSLLSLQLFYTPFRMLGIGQLSSLYLSLAAFTFLGVFFTVRALCRFHSLTKPEILLIAFLSHFCLCMTNFLGHYQLFGFQVAPAFFLYLFWYLTDFRAKDLLIVCFLFSFGAGLSIYLAPMLALSSIFFSLPLLLFQLRAAGMLTLIRKIGWISPLIAITSCLFLYALQLWPYFHLSAIFPLQSYEETKTYSAKLLSLIHLPSIHSYWHRPSAGNYSEYGDWERAYFPGFTALALLALLCCRICWKGFSNLKIETRFFQFTAAVFALFLAAYLFSLGPFVSEGNHRFPFWYASEISSAFRSIRAPGRFGMLLGLPLGWIAVVFLRDFFQNARLRQKITLILFCLILCESITLYRVFPYSEEKKNVYERLALEITPGSPLLELPVSRNDHILNIRTIMEQLNGGSYHHAPLVVGYGGKTTNTYQEALHIDQQVQARNSEPEALTEFGEKLGIRNFVIHLDRYPQEMRDDWESALSELGKIERVGESIIVRAE